MKTITTDLATIMWKQENLMDLVGRVRGETTAPYVAHQTSGRATVEQFDGQIWIGGTADVRVTGTIAL